MLEIIITSSVLIVFLILLRRLCRDRISRRMQYALWFLAAVRLLVPVTLFGNPFSIMNMLQPAAERMEVWAEETRFFADRESTGQGIVQEESRKEKTLWEENTGNKKESGGVTFQAETLRQTEGIVSEGKDRLSADRQTGGSKMSLRELERILEGGEMAGTVSVRRFLRYGWFAGMIVMGLWMAGSNLVFRYRIFRKRKRLGREGRIRVYMAENISTPCLLGILYPAVYLTPDSVRNEKHRRYALCHELTHYRHGDHIWTFVRNLCLVVYWFHPLVWIGASLAARDCELACDEGVLRLLGEEKAREYGCTLIEMASSSLKRPRALRCEAGLAYERQELKERIARIAAGRRSTGILAAALALACGAGLAACTFGGINTEPATGRYVENTVELPGAGKEYEAIARCGETIRLIARAGMDVVSLDGGLTFDRVKAEDMPAGTAELYRRNYFGMAGSVGGARVFMQMDYSYSTQSGSYESRLITEGGEEISLETLGDHYVRLFYDNGCFYLVESDTSVNRFYKMDPATGEMQLLMETVWQTLYAAADEKLLYLVNKDGVLLYDLEKGEKAQRQDQVLSDFVAENASLSMGEYPALVYPYGEGVYILVRRGLYWHELYGESMEEVIDGGFCAIGDIDREFTGMALRETEGEPEFLIMYNDRELIRYTYDASLPTVPEAVRIFSVYEDSQIMRAVNTFRTRHPEIPVIYDIGMGSEYGAVIDDVLKNLATEIAAGNGPDILVMDDIPFEAYAEKGVLADLSDLRKGMAEEDWFVNVIDAFDRDGRLYAVPMTFAVPVLGGNEEKIAGLETLSELADLLEKEKAEGREEHVFCTWDAESTLRLLAQSSQGAWLESGVFDREAVTGFLTQAKRIYDIRIDENQEEEEYSISSHNLVTPGLWIGDYLQYPLARRFDADGIFCMLEVGKERGYADFYAGFVSGGERDYMLLHGIQEYYGESYVRMPGQRYGSCLASSLLAVNSASKCMQESKLFLEYAISEEFYTNGVSDSYRENSFNGTPINRAAYLAKQRTESQGDGFEGYGGFGMSNARGGYENIVLEWPSVEDYEKLTGILDGITGVNICDPVVYEAVIEYGVKALTGQTSIEEAVNAVEKRVKLYLSE